MNESLNETMRLKAGSETFRPGFKARYDRRYKPLEQSAQSPNEPIQGFLRRFDTHSITYT